MKSFNDLSLFLQNGNDIYSTASTQSHKQQLHWPDAEIHTAAFRAAVKFYGMAICILCFEAIITFLAVDFNSYHLFLFLANVIHIELYFAFSKPESIDGAISYS